MNGLRWEKSKTGEHVMTRGGTVAGSEKLQFHYLVRNDELRGDLRGLQGYARRSVTPDGHELQVFLHQNALAAKKIVFVDIFHEALSRERAVVRVLMRTRRRDKRVVSLIEVVLWFF